MSTGMRNILYVYDLASPEEKSVGRTWYEDARHLAFVLAHSADHRPAVTLDQAAGVVAALSPRTPWERNKELATRAVVDGQASGSLGNSVRAADRILAGEDPRDVLKGDKVRNFFLSIIGDPTAVTIDRHAFEVFMGRRYVDKERPAVGKRVYREASAAYIDAAAFLATYKEEHITTSQLQAITWLTWRRMHLTGTKYERFL